MYYAVAAAAMLWQLWAMLSWVLRHKADARRRKLIVDVSARPTQGSLLFWSFVGQTPTCYFFFMFSLWLSYRPTRRQLWNIWTFQTFLMLQISKYRVRIVLITKKKKIENAHFSYSTVYIGKFLQHLKVFYLSCYLDMLRLVLFFLAKEKIQNIHKTSSHLEVDLLLPSPSMAKTDLTYCIAVLPYRLAFLLCVNNYMKVGLMVVASLN